MTPGPDRVNLKLEKTISTQQPSFSSITIQMTTPRLDIKLYGHFCIKNHCCKVFDKDSRSAMKAYPLVLGLRLTCLQQYWKMIFTGKMQFTIVGMTLLHCYQGQFK